MATYLGYSDLHPVPVEDHRAGLEPYHKNVAGLEAVPRREEEKQPIPTLSPQASGDRTPQLYNPGIERVPTQKRDNGKRKRTRLLLVVGIVVLIIVIAVAVPVGLKFSHSNAQSATASTIPAPNPTATTTATATRAFSTTGAFNGSGMSLIDSLYGADEARLYFQHYTGDLREVFTKSNVWTGGSASNIVVDSGNVRNATPIAAEAYNEGSNVTYQVVYIDDSNTVRDVVQYNFSGKWAPGTLGDSNFKASSSDRVALTICASDDWTKGPSNDGSGWTPRGGVKLYYGGEDEVIHELWRGYGDKQWTEIFSFPSTFVSNAGLDCYTGNSYQYLFGLVADQTLGYWWRDSNPNKTSTTQNPVGVWTPGASSAVSLNPNSSISFADRTNAYFQDPNDNIIAIVPNLTIGAQSWGGITQVSKVKGVPGTRLASHSIFPRDQGKPPQSFVYFQREGDTLTEFIQSNNQGQWTSDELPVE